MRSERRGLQFFLAVTALIGTAEAGQYQVPVSQLLRAQLLQQFGRYPAPCSNCAGALCSRLGSVHIRMRWQPLDPFPFCIVTACVSGAALANSSKVRLTQPFPLPGYCGTDAQTTSPQLQLAKHLLPVGAAHGHLVGAHQQHVAAEALHAGHVDEVGFVDAHELAGG